MPMDQCCDALFASSVSIVSFVDCVGKTLETLEGVRVRLKLRVEQIDVMKERLRVHMEKRSTRVSLLICLVCLSSLFFFIISTSLRISFAPDIMVG